MTEGVANRNYFILMQGQSTMMCTSPPDTYFNESLFDGKRVRVEIYNTAGAEEFADNRTLIYGRTDGT